MTSIKATAPPGLENPLFPGNFFHGCIHAKGRPIGPVVGHGFHDIVNCKDFCLHDYLVPALGAEGYPDPFNLSRDAGARLRGDRPREFYVFQYVVPRLGVGFDEHGFVVVELARLRENLRRNDDFPNIMKETHHPDALQSVLGESEVSDQLHRPVRLHAFDGRQCKDLSYPQPAPKRPRSP